MRNKFRLYSLSASHSPVSTDTALMASYGSFSRASDAVYAEQWGHSLVLWLLCQQPTFTTAYLLYYGSDGSRCVRSQSPLYCITCDAIKHEKQPNKLHKQSLQVPLSRNGWTTHSIGWIHRLCSCHDSSHSYPHAILLSVTGQLFPSSFSSSFIPSLSLIIIIMSLTYGVASGTIDSVAKMHKILVGGLEVGSRLVPTYLIGIQLYMSIRYVFIL